MRTSHDLFVDPGTRAQSVESAPRPGQVAQVAEVELPAEVAASVQALAVQQGRSPNAVLAEAWRMYLESHIDELNAAVAVARLELDQADASPEGHSDEPELDAWAAAAAAAMRDG